MTTLSTALHSFLTMDDESRARSFQVGTGGRVNGRTSRDCPRGHILLAQPKSSENDIRVTITSEFMSQWKPAAWKDAGLKGKKVEVLLSTTQPGFVMFRPVAPDTIGLGIYRLEQPSVDGQARLMTTRRYLDRRLGSPVEFVPFEVEGDLAMADLRKLKDLASDTTPLSI